jgi:hypothetical protein
LLHLTRYISNDISSIRILTADGHDPVLEDEDDILVQNDVDIETFNEDQPLSPSVLSNAHSDRFPSDDDMESPDIGEGANQWEPPSRIASPAAASSGGVAHENNSEIRQGRIPTRNINNAVFTDSLIGVCQMI